jgi:hypothetical protein
MQFFRSIFRFAETKKFWVAALTAVGVFGNTMAGRDLGITSGDATAVVNLVAGLIGAWGVWKVTNE